jgi:hypothetical protein
MSGMDALRRDDIERASQLTPAQRLSRALDAMAAGIQLKRDSLRQRFPTASPSELEAMVDRWLAHPDD